MNNDKIVQLKSYDEKNGTEIGNVLPITNSEAVKVENDKNLKEKLTEITNKIDQTNTSLDENKTELKVVNSRVNNFTTLPEGSTTGDAELMDGRVGADGKVYRNIGNAIREQIKEHDVLDKPYNVLYLSPDRYNVGFVDLTGSIYKNDKNYMYTDYIKVYGNKIYWKNLISHRLIRYITCFDKDKKAIIGIGINATTSALQISGEYELPLNCFYVIVTMFSENKNEAYKSVVGFKPIVGYEKPDTRYINSKFINNQNIIDTINNLSWKIVYSFGDSLLAGHYSGDGFLDGLVAEYNMEYGKYAINGAKVIQNIINQIYNAPSTPPDFVVLDGMTNDATSDITNILGELTSLNNFTGTFNQATFYGSLEHIFYTLRNKYPDTKIIYVIPHLMPTRPIERQKTLAEAVIKTCKKWSISVVNIQEEGQINTCIQHMRIKYSYDNKGETSGGNGTHLTGDAYDKWYKPMIKAKMLELI